MEIQDFTDVGFFFFNEDADFTLDSEKEITNCLSLVLSDHNIELGCINVVFCSDDRLLEMNKEYLDHDYYTDILTFPMSNSPLSGDLFISVDRVLDYANKNSIPFDQELSRVIIHGVLHLVGYNDKSEDEVTIIRSKENHYLATLV